MSSTKIAMVTVIIIFVFGLGALYLFVGLKPQDNLAQVESPVATATPFATPTPALQRIEGEVIAISDDTVIYKDSLVITVQDTENIPHVVYIPQELDVVRGGTTVRPSALRVGQTVQLELTPAEGAYEATALIIVPATTPTRVPTTEPTEITPTPEEN